MPTYEYACRSCGEHLEIVQSFSDPSLTTCPKCGSELRKVFSSIGIVFKGSGFYKTDSRSKNGATTSASSAPETKSETPASPDTSTATSAPATTTPAASAASAAPAAPAAPASASGS